VAGALIAGLCRADQLLLRSVRIAFQRLAEAGVGSSSEFEIFALKALVSRHSISASSC
jgi:hypothetical protein